MAPLWKLLPLMVICWALFDPGTGFGVTLVIVGTAVEADTVKLKAVELCPPGLTTVTVQVPASLASLNPGSSNCPEFTNVELWPG